MNFDDFLFDEDKKRKKSINSSSKGKRVERELCDILGKRFGKVFTRSIGSGNRWSQVSEMAQHAKDTLLGDLCCPEGFSWVVESKGGYEEDIDLNGIFSGNSVLDEFLSQAIKEMARSGKLPLVCWKRKRKPWICGIRLIDIPDRLFETYFVYKGWIFVELTELLKYPDRFFFK